MTRIAVVQFDPELGAPARNLDQIEAHAARAAEGGAELAVFPECAVTGYVYRSLDEALEQSQEIPGAISDRLAGIAAQNNLYMVVGLLERAGGRCFNAAILCGPGGLLAVYRKTHTLCLGVDRFTTPGDIPYQVHDLPFGRLGILICYDLRFPEAARSLALRGAQLLVLPTNWPVSSTIQPDVFVRARAGENRVYIAAANRVGAERGTRFLGRSQIVAPDGMVVAEGSRDASEMLLQDVDLSAADQKHVVLTPGEHEMNCFQDRRPEMYRDLVAEPLAAEVR
ncbi:MAG: carbon-nitrogen hydrolase family protein [Chloroflexota bacterium]